jgi:hypothetical protein
VTVGPLISGVICDLTVDINSINVVVSTCAEKSGHSKKWKCFITLVSSPCNTKLISIEQNYLFSVSLIFISDILNLKFTRAHRKDWYCYGDNLFLF